MTVGELIEKLNEAQADKGPNVPVKLELDGWSADVYGVRIPYVKVLGKRGGGFRCMLVTDEQKLKKVMAGMEGDAKKEAVHEKYMNMTALVNVRNMKSELNHMIESIVWAPLNWKLEFGNANEVASALKTAIENLSAIESALRDRVYDA